MARIQEFLFLTFVRGTAGSAQDCKAILVKGESSLTQHRTLLSRFRIAPDHRWSHPVVNRESIKWWELKNVPQGVHELTKALPSLGDSPEVS